MWASTREKGWEGEWDQSEISGSRREEPKTPVYETIFHRDYSFCNGEKSPVYDRCVSTTKSSESPRVYGRTGGDVGTTPTLET